MSGPAPMPTIIKMKTGNRGKRPINDKEPQPKVEIPEKPSMLNEYASAEWDKITPELAKLGLLTKIDSASITIYCQLYGQWVDANLRLLKDGLMVNSRDGNPYQNPYLGISNKIIEKLQKLLCEFGMTPASRSRIKVDLPKKDEEFDI